MADTGRPSKYDPAFCDEAVTFLEQGYSTTALAGHLKVSRSTLYKWADEHEAFSDALKTGQAMSAVWWEDRLRAVAMGEDGNASAAIFGLKNRAADDWREKVIQDHTSSDGSMTPKEQSPRDLAKALLAGLQKAAKE